MNEKELKLNWVEDDEGDFVAVHGKFKLLTEEFKYSGFVGRILWSGCVCWHGAKYLSHKAAQEAAEQAARELCGQFKVLGEVLGATE